MKLTLTICLAATFIGGVPNVAASEEASWAFNAPRGDGYTVDLDRAEPKPGTPLLRGSKVSFQVSVNYVLESAKHGTVILVFQDEQNQSVSGDRDQTTVEVADGSGSLVLTDSIVVPTNAHELRLFIPLVPNGMKTTTGEITIRYPITTSADGPQYMPYPLADISDQEWEKYYRSVDDTCGSTRRAFPKEHLEVFECPANSLHLAFTTDGHPAHPAWITRQVRAGTVDQIGYFAGQEGPFAELFQSYLDLTNKMMKKIPDKVTE